MRTRAARVGISLTVTIIFLVSVLIAAQVSAAPGLWPAKKGELCWVVTATIPEPDEYSLVRAQITNMGQDHYLFHGQAFRVNNPTDLVQSNDVQALGGNVEFDPNLDAWIGQITKTEYNSGWLEVYTGLMNLDATTLNGQVEGVITTCLAGDESEICDMLITGPITLTYIPCP